MHLPLLPNDVVESKSKSLLSIVAGLVVLCLLWVGGVRCRRETDQSAVPLRQAAQPKPGISDREPRSFDESVGLDSLDGNPREQGSTLRPVRQAVSEEPKAVRRITVTADDVYGTSVPLADVTLHFEDESPRTGKTNLEGRRYFTLRSDQEVLYIEVQRRGYASARVNLSDSPLIDEVQITLVRPAVLAVRVVDDSGLLRGSHIVELYMRGTDIDQAGSPFGEASSSAKADRHVFTRSDGIVLIDDLHPGAWEISCPEWRACDHSERLIIGLVEGQEEEITVRVRRRPTSHFASGVIVLPSDAQAQDGVMKNYYLIVKQRNSTVPIYDNGDFAVFGSPRETLDVRVVKKEEETVDSAHYSWFHVSVGEHGYIHKL